MKWHPWVNEIRVSGLTGIDGVGEGLAIGGEDGTLTGAFASIVYFFFDEQTSVKEPDFVVAPTFVQTPPGLVAAWVGVVPEMTNIKVVRTMRLLHAIADLGRAITTF